MLQTFLRSECNHRRDRGSVFIATAFLNRISAEEAPFEKLDYNDPDYQGNVLLRAVRLPEQLSSGDKARPGTARESRHAH
jgi:hypothetical protein